MKKENEPEPSDFEPILLFFAIGVIILGSSLLHVGLGFIVMFISAYEWYESGRNEEGEE